MQLLSLIQFAESSMLRLTLASIVHAETKSARYQRQNSPQDNQNDILVLLLNPCNKILSKRPSSVKESGKNERLGSQVIRFEPKLDLCSAAAKTETSNYSQFQTTSLVLRVPFTILGHVLLM